MDHNQWLAKNSIDCAPLGARISPAQCKANHGHTFACEDCPHGGVKYVGPAKVVKPDRNKQPSAPEVRPANPPMIATKEKTMTKLAKGTCPTCKRTAVTLTQTKAGDCFRCYDRIKKGKDPVTGLIGQAVPPVPPPKATQETAVPQQDAVLKAPASAAAPPVAGTCTIDVVQVLDSLLAEKRASMVEKLNSSKSICSQLALAHTYVERINALGV